MKNTDVITAVQHEGAAGRGEEEVGGIQTCTEPFKTPVMNWTSCSMVSVGSPGRKYCSLDVLRMMTEGTATSLGKRHQIEF